jgi:hypothetical protein
MFTGNGFEGDLGEIVSQMSRTYPFAHPREKFYPICFIQKSKLLVNFSLKLEKLLPVLTVLPNPWFKPFTQWDMVYIHRIDQCTSMESDRIYIVCF